MLAAQIGEQVPGEQALARHDESFAIGFDDFEEASGVTRQVDVFAGESAVIDDTDVHCSGMQVDSAVVWMLLLIEPHHRSPVGQVVDPVIRRDDNPAV